MNQTPISMNHDTYRRETFLKSVTVAGGTVRFQHRGSEYFLTSPCFKKLEGMEVLVDAHGNVKYGNKKVGQADHVTTNH